MPSSSLAGGGAPDLVLLPVFTSSQVLLPTAQGRLTIYEPRYLAMFDQLVKERPSTGQGARFLHILSPAAAPPAMVMDSRPVGGLPEIGCCAVIDSITRQFDGTLLVDYVGDRRMRLIQVEGAHSDAAVATAAGLWLDDAEASDASVDAAERDVAAIVRHIQKLSRNLDPESAGLPEAIPRYAPPAAGASRQTSYDALKAAGHKAASAIDTWRRHGSVYSSQRVPREAHGDPYTDVAEQMGKARRQELFSFAVCQLLTTGTPERAALLLSQDTAGRLQFVLEALRPYLAELGAKASLKGALGQQPPS